MTSHIHGTRRLVVVALLLCLMVLGQSAALAGQSEAHHGPDHCCLLCHVGPIPFLQTSVSAILAPVFQVVWLAPTAQFEFTSDILGVPTPSRAPPVR